MRKTRIGKIAAGMMAAALVLQSVFVPVMADDTASESTEVLEDLEALEGLEEIAQNMSLIFMQLHAAVNECCCRCPDRNDRKAAQKPYEIENPDLSELRYTSPYYIVYTKEFHCLTSPENSASDNIHRF